LRRPGQANADAVLADDPGAIGFYGSTARPAAQLGPTATDRATIDGSSAPTSTVATDVMHAIAKDRMIDAALDDDAPPATVGDKTLSTTSSPWR